MRYLVDRRGLRGRHLVHRDQNRVFYTIMVTGAIWEKVVFGQYLFAPAFFWEDVFSFARDRACTPPISGRC